MTDTFFSVQKEHCNHCLPQQLGVISNLLAHRKRCAPVACNLSVQNKLFKILFQWSADETNGNTKTLGFLHVNKAKHISKRVNIEKLVLREPDTALFQQMLLSDNAMIGFFVELKLQDYVVHFRSQHPHSFQFGTSEIRKFSLLCDAYR